MFIFVPPSPIDPSEPPTLVSDKTYYVDPILGLDTNNGSQLTPFRTIQNALNIVKELEFDGNRCAIQLADGTYDEELIFPSLATSNNNTLNRLFIQGNNTNPENVVLTSTTGYGLVIRYEQRFILKNLTLQNNTGSIGFPALYCQFGGGCFLENVRFGPTTGDHIFIDQGSYVSIISNVSGGNIEETNGVYSIAGNCRYHIVLAGGGQFRCQNANISTNTVNFDAFIFANSGAIGDFSGTTYTGTATGQKYVFGSSVSITPPVGDYGGFPGNIAGVGLALSDPTPAIEALETAIATKENTINPGTANQYWRGDKTFQTLDKNAVGLGNVNNTSDADKPISTATQSALNSKFNTPSGTTNQYIRGDGSLATFPTSVNTYGSFYAAAPTVKNIPLFTATRATTINELRGVDTSAGTATISIQINGVNVTGLSNLSVTSTPQNFTASGANTVAVGARVTVNISAVSSAVDLELTMGATLN